MKKCADSTMLAFIKKHLEYPELAKKHRIEGTAVIRLVLDKDGLSNPEIMENPGMGTGEEALRVVKLMLEKYFNYTYKWEPPRARLKSGSVHYRLPVKFKLDENTNIPE